MASEEIKRPETQEEKVKTVKTISEENTEQTQEKKLLAKYPGLKGPGSSAFLQNRLFQGQKKYFDSGDYNMAKAKSGGGVLARPVMAPPAGPASGQKLFLPGPVGSAIPTPDSVSHRKSSLIQSKLAASQ